MSSAEMIRFGLPEGGDETVAQPQGDRATCWRRLSASEREPQEAPRLRFLHVMQPGASVQRLGERVRVVREGTMLLQVAAERLEGVLLYGSVQISTQAAGLLADKGVWVSFHTRGGRFRGRLQPAEPRLPGLRQRQRDRASDPDYAIAMARQFVKGKALSMLDVADAYGRNYPGSVPYAVRVQIGSVLQRCGLVTTPDQLRGVEGAVTRSYFELLRRFNRSDLPFESRAQRPAPDPVNALLSLGYTFVTNELAGLLEAAGLDPTLGFYHALDGARPSLACDWIEEFRHACVDRLVLGLLNRKCLTAGDFEPFDQRRGVRLREPGFRTFIEAYERAMVGSAEAAGRSRCLGWRTVFLQQLGQLVTAISTGGLYRSHLEAKET